MTPIFDPAQLRYILPEIVLTICAFMILGLSTLRDTGRRLWAPGLSILACVMTLLVVLSYPWITSLEWLRTASPATTVFNGMFVLDAFAIFFKIIFLVAAILTIMVSSRYLEIEGYQAGEYYALTLFAVVGMMFMASAEDFIAIFVSLETMAISFYILVGFLKGNRKSNEAALKYFLLGSFSTGILLYGISLVYGMTGTTNLAGIARQAAAALGPDTAPIFLLGVILVTVGLGFKIAAVPFHMWAPDAYEGAPTPVTAFLSTASKAAAFVVLVRVFAMAFAGLGDRWATLLAILAVASMTLGNIAAILQDNIKRMLAYSSISHAGYALMGLIAVGLGGPAGTRDFGLTSVILYIFIYTFVNIGAFALVIMLRREHVVGDRLVDFAGLAQRAPFASFAMLVFMLSLAGIPATAGFVGKWYLFGAAVRADYTWLAVVAVLNSAISLYYYARVVVMMYMREPEDDARLAPSLGQRLAILTCIAFTLVFGIYPQPIVALAQRSILALWAS